MTRAKSKLVTVLASSAITLCACGNIENAGVSNNNTAPEAEKTQKNTSYYSAESSISLGINIIISGNGVHIENNVINITKGGTFSVTGQISGLSFYIKAPPDENVTLKLDNVMLTDNKKPVINCEKAQSLNISLANGSRNSFIEAENEDLTTEFAFIYANCPVEINGSGTLEIKTAKVSRFTEAFKGENGLTIKEAALYMDTPNIDSIKLNGEFICEDGSVNIISGKNGIKCSRYAAESGNVVINAEGEKIIREP